ncbi:MAG: universal stress protein [Psychroserpens sp.]|nr:universal stress protein [Psychroserpens sp.]
MKKIIIPVDFSQYSEYALETGAYLARRHNAEIIVMHMLELSDSIFSSSSSEKSEETAFMLMITNKKFETFLDKPYLEGLSVTPMIKNRKVLKELNEITTELKADLVVMGSRGHNDFDGVFTGSNTEKVVRHSNVPVLVVKSKPEDAEFKSIVLATDFSEDSQSAVVNAMELLDQLSVKITLLHINRPNMYFQSTDEIDEKIYSFLEKINHPEWESHVDRIADYSIGDAVLGYAKKHNMDGIAVITNGRKGINHLVSGSISEDLVNQSKLPVVTFRK